MRDEEIGINLEPAEAYSNGSKKREFFRSGFG
jgi:hypothetical protein